MNKHPSWLVRYSLTPKGCIDPIEKGLHKDSMYGSDDGLQILLNLFWIMKQRKRFLKGWQGWA